MTIVRIAGLLVCVGCIAIGCKLVAENQRQGYISIIAGAVLGALWIVLLVAAR